MPAAKSLPAKLVHVQSDDEDETSFSQDDLRLAQALTGELMRVASRTRPDIMYTTGLMSRMLHRRPRYTAELGFHALRYLHGSVDVSLDFKKSPDLDVLSIFNEKSSDLVLSCNLVFGKAAW